jgi:hypothetical protein
VADETRQITYEGPAALAYRLVQCLNDEGVTADWTPPVDALGDDLVGDESVLVNIAASGSSNAVKEGVRKFQQRHGHGHAVIEGEDD